jgi:hypothetical protein
MWAKTIVSGNNINEGVVVIERTDDNYFEVVNNIATSIKELINNKTVGLKEKCFDLAQKADWGEFITYYYKAFELAFERKTLRNCQDIKVADGDCFVPRNDVNRNEVIELNINKIKDIE